MKARYYIENPDRSVTCTLCPHMCRIREGEHGLCGIRINSGGNIISLAYGRVSALNVDPIEKKPLYHFYPGSSILSLGSFGCNLKCNFCQNHNISQVNPIQLSDGISLSPADIANKAKSLANNIGMAYTYNEPIVWHEFMLDTAMLIQEKKLKNVLISNGYINPEPLKDLIPLIDAYNIDLKAFDNDFYKNRTGSTLKPVLRSIKNISLSGKHLEITCLIIPGLNDNRSKFKDMIKWITDNCGSETVIHLSKYFPNYKSDIPLTPDKDLIDLYEIAKTRIYYTYLGNTSLQNGRDTICPVCSNIVIERKGYSIRRNGLTDSGNCTKCDTSITGHSTFL